MIIVKYWSPLLVLFEASQILFDLAGLRVRRYFVTLNKLLEHLGLPN